MRTPRPKFPAAITALMTIAAAASAQQPPADGAPDRRPQTPAVQQPAKPVEDRPQQYVVKQGDTLKSIARRFGLDYRDLAAWNGLKGSQKILVGQALRLYPDGSGSTPAASNASPPPAPAPRPSAAKSSPAPRPAAAQSRPAKAEQVATPALAATPATAAAVVASAPASVAQEKQELQQLHETTLNLIKLLVQEGLLTQEKADRLVREAERGAVHAESPAAPAPRAVPAQEVASAKAAAQSAPQPPKPVANVVRVPYVPEVVKNEIRDQVKEEVIAQAKAEHWAEPNARPEWLDRIGFDGDLRFRYQGNFYSGGNAPTAVYQAITGNTNVPNTTNDETWWRVRARLGVNARLSDTFKARLSIATGNALNPISLNQDMASYFSGYSVQLDNAYLRYDPSERFNAVVGRFPKPFFSSEMVWWDDLVMDGASLTYQPRLSQNLSAFVTGGGFLIQSPQSTAITPDPKLKSMLGLQGGATWDLGTNTALKLGLAYYDFQHVEGESNTIAAPNAADWTVPKFIQKGNQLFDINFGTGNPSKFALASKFKVANLTAALDLKQFDPYVVRLTGDFVKNLAYDEQEILRRTGLLVPRRDKGYQAQIQFGAPEVLALHDWQVFLMYRHLEGDAVMDAFNDPDFHVGGTNAKGYTIGAKYGLGHGAWLRLRWMSADEIDGPPLGIDVLQLDLNAKF